MPAQRPEQIEHARDGKAAIRQEEDVGTQFARQEGVNLAEETEDLGRVFAFGKRDILFPGAHRQRQDQPLIAETPGQAVNAILLAGRIQDTTRTARKRA
jgi:hypothetical protein